jgi:predicted membrane protein
VTAVPEEPRRPRPASGLVLFGAALAVIGIVWLLATTDVLDISLAGVLSILLIAVGLALIAGARTGRRTGLIVLGIVLALLAAAASAVDVPIGEGVGDRTERPTSAGNLDDKYSLGVGQLTVDLNAVELPRGETEIECQVGLGELLVIVPEGVAVKADGHAGAGQVDLFDKSDDGEDVDASFTDDGYESAERRLALDLSVGLGEVRLERG